MNVKLMAKQLVACKRCRSSAAWRTCSDCDKARAIMDVMSGATAEELLELDDNIRDIEQSQRRVDAYKKEMDRNESFHLWASSIVGILYVGFIFFFLSGVWTRWL